MSELKKCCAALVLVMGSAVLGGCSSMTWSAAPADASFVAAAPGLPLDEKGYIRHWLVAGPIRMDASAPEDIEKEQIPNEASLLPREGGRQKVKTAESVTSSAIVERELTWYRIDTEDYFFDLNAALEMETSEGCLGYAVAYLDAAQEMKEITLSLCSNDKGKILLNGEGIYTFLDDRSTVEDADSVTGLTLKKGINVVVFKVWNTSNNWQGNIRLLTADGKVVTGVTVKVPK